MLSLGQWGLFTLVIIKNWTQATTSKSDSVCFPDSPTGCWDASSSVPPSFALREAALSLPLCSTPEQHICMLAWHLHCGSSRHPILITAQQNSRCPLISPHFPRSNLPVRPVDSTSKTHHNPPTFISIGPVILNRE